MAAVTALDIFAGAGGFSVGAEKAGAEILFAINHYPPATWTLRQNHPGAEVVSRDAEEYNWEEAPDVDLVLASPACQGFAKASTHGGKGRRGRAPKHDRDRATVWAVPRGLEMKRPAFAIVENVPEFLDWIAYRHGKGYMQDAGPGYHVREHVVDCADFGVPSHRDRVFISAVSKAHSRKPFAFKIPRRKHVGIGTCLDDRRPKGVSPWKRFSECAPGVQRLITRGRRTIPTGRFVNNNVTSSLGIPLDKPNRAITGQSGHWKVVRKGPHGEDECREWTIKEYLCAMGFPAGYKLPKGKCKGIRLIGNAVPPPVSRELVKQIVRRG